MTSRFGKRNRSSSKLEQSGGYSSSSAGDLSKRIKDLEKSLEEKDKTIAGLEEKIKELSSELERRKDLTDVLTSERNALRQKNASLVGKLAELSRKQSVSSFTTLPSPPELPKRYPAISTRPDLPPTPASPETPFEDPDQEESGAHTPRFNFGSPPHTLQHQQQPPNGHIGQTSPPQSNHVLATTKGDESETDYSDMEDDLEAVSPVVDTMTTAQPSTDSQSTSNGRVAQLQSAGDDDKSDFVNSGLVRESEIDSVLAAVQETVRKTNFAMTNSERKESPRLSQRGRRKEEEREKEEERAGGSSKEESLKAKAMVDNTSQEETGERGNVRLHKRPSVEALAAQFERVSSTSTASIPTSSLKWRSQNHQGSPHSPSTLSDVSPSELTFSETPTAVSKPRSSSLRGNSSSDTPLSTSHNRTPSVRSAGSGSSPEPRRFNSGSEGIASRIASLFSSNRKGSKDKGSPSLPPPPPTSGEAKSMTMMNGGGSMECQNGGSAVQSMDTPLANETPLTNETPTTDDCNAPKGASELESLSTMKRFKQDSVASNMGSDLISSGDYSTTDVDSSFDLTSPPTSPASSLGASSLASASISLPANKRLEGIEARNALLSRLENRNLKKSPMIHRVRLQERGADEDEEGEEEECDTLGDLVSMDPRQKMRERTKTVSMTQGVSSRTTTELGRQKRTKKEIREKQFALKRHHSLTDLRLLAGTFALKELELISPDFESKIREKIVKSVGEKYGGLEKATQAAIKIQQSWRQFKLRSRFQKIKQQNKSQLQLQMRKRAQSMRDPRRRPSIMKKRGKRAYLREASVAGLPSVEQKLKTSTSGLVHGVGHSKTNIKVPPTVKIEEQLTEQEEETEGERKKVVEIMEVSADTMLEGGNTTTVSIQPPKLQLNDSSVQVSDAPGPMAAVAVQITDSSTTPSHNNVQSDSPDGLTASLTTADLRSSPRPLSVFSTGSSVSPSGSYQEGLMVQSLTMNSVTLPRLRSRPHCDQDPLGRDRALSVGSAIFNRRRAIGINHFNRKPTKGIQYLVESQVLDDDPKSVADFLTDGKNKLCKQKIGEFVGEINSDFNMAVLGCLLEQMDMSGKPIDKALRELQQLFRMPGEAQKIDKIMEIFALEYFKHNKENGSVKSEDAAYILSFAIMMLHTALHNPSVKHKTTKREWVSMNRGCNDGENFYENFLLDIYDRIQSTEFVCGKDHTQEVAEIEKQIITVANLPKLATSQRHLVLKLNVSEVLDLSRGPNFRQRHRRTLFIFNDLLIVCKQRRHEQYQCRNFFPLLHVLPVKFETEHYRNGIQLLSSIERKVLLQCTCDSLGERKTLLEKLEETIKELEEMEQERIEELGSSLSAKPGQDVHIGGSMRHSSASRSHSRSTADLQVSSSLGKLASSSLTDLREESYEEDTQVRPSSYVHVRNNRASGDSGFDSPQQDADTPISTPTPSPTEQNHIDASDSQTPSPSPSPSPALLPPPTSPHQNSHTMPRGAITHSKSHDGLRTLTVYPSTPERSPSAELIRPSPTSSPSPSPSHKKAQKKEKKQRSHYVNINIFSRSKGKESKSGGSGKGGSSSPGASPMHNRKRRASDSAQAVHSVGVRETSPSNMHVPLAQSLNLNANFGTGNLSDNEGQSYP